MNEESKIDKKRRKFLEYSVLAAICTTKIILKRESDANLKKTDDEINPAPVNMQLDQKTMSEIWGQSNYTPHIFETNINEIQHKSLGVSHTRKFAQIYYDTLEELVKNSKYVISEGGPEHLEKEYVFNDAKAYFGTIIKLCQRYHKPLIFTDPLTTTIEKSELALFMVAMAGITLNNKQTASRRTIIKNVVKAGLAYLSIGSSIENYIKTPLDYETYFNSIGAQKARYFSAIDQRNVELTRRITALSKVLPQKYTNGNYVLFTYGKLHTAGIEYYLKHPNILQAKHLLYASNYNLIDNDDVKEYSWNNNSWNMKPIQLTLNQ